MEALHAATMPLEARQAAQEERLQALEASQRAADDQRPTWRDVILIAWLPSP